jgi:hypothetical protein
LQLEATSLKLGMLTDWVEKNLHRLKKTAPLKITRVRHPNYFKSIATKVS